MRRATAARFEHDETRRTTVSGHRKFQTPRSAGDVYLSEPGRSFTRTNRSTRTQMEELKLLSNQARFISAIISGEIKYIRRKMKELLQDIIDKGFDPILREGLLPVPGDEGEAAAAGETAEEHGSCYYEYLTSMPLGFFNDDYVQHLLKRISEIEEAMRSSHTDHGEARSGPEAAGDDGVSDSETAAAPRRRRKRSAAESVVPMDDVYNDEEAAAALYDYLAAIAGLGPRQHEPGTVSTLQRRPTKKQRRKKSSIVGALLPLEDINTTASTSTGTNDAWTSGRAVPYSLSTLGFARSI
ncbi:hypothetical protein VPH35_032847 [Triticum aestivum]|uniref:DNA topoisomerase 2 isoform X2 n=1 Tax=Triticum aestivum TaxID=4565 RepID=UPI001D021349|nr:DNA topoisomerase 2-like isoform X2 [Triticum aestivum]